MGKEVDSQLAGDKTLQEDRQILELRALPILEIRDDLMTDKTWEDQAQETTLIETESKIDLKEIEMNLFLKWEDKKFS